MRAFELVTADGQLVRADRDNEPDLFWALRGGGGSFGVVTAVELELFPIQRAYAGVLFYPIERGGEVLHAWRELTQSDRLPDELTTVGRFLRLPPIPDIPEPVRGKSFVIVEAYHIGDPAEARRAARSAARARAGQRHDRNGPDAGAQPPAHGPRASRARRWRRDDARRSCPREAVDAFVEAAGAERRVPAPDRRAPASRGRAQPP